LLLLSFREKMGQQMKKLNPNTESLEVILSEDDNLAPVVPIRTETVLSQYPLHHLSKSDSPLQVSITKTSDRGTVTTTWKVSPNTEYGEPGILAYKLDTLVVNRRVDELRGDIPEILYIGNWSEIQELLGVKTRNYKALKQSFSQNAGAFISAKIEYAGKDGRNRTVEFRSTRYGVIFVGEELPNGEKAEAVYLSLNPSFREVLRHAKTRPLDYEYLKSLPPASQRLYELISYQIFAALKHNNPRAKYLYSDLCKYAPITRYDEYERVKKQMYKLHSPHSKAGYIKKAEFELTTDTEGRPDWIIWYTPGRKARHEYRIFTTKRIAQQESTTLRLAAPQRIKTEALSPKQEPKRSAQDSAIIEKLTLLGIDEGRAVQLVEANRHECELWGDAWQYQNQKGMDNPAAVLISFIEKKRRPLPKGYSDAKKREAQQKEQEQAEQRRFADDCYFDFFAPQFRVFLREEFARLQANNAEAFKTFATWLEKNHGRGLRMVDGEETREKITLQRAWEFFGSIRPELGVRMTSFEEWNEHHNTHKADPLEWFAQNPDVLEKLYQ
jgi:hypothetical protein